MLQQELSGQLIREFRVRESTGCLGSSSETPWTQGTEVLGTTTCKDTQNMSVLGNSPDARRHPGDLHRKWTEK